MRALADVLGKDIPSVGIINHLTFRIIVAGIWETGTWGWGGGADNMGRGSGRIWEHSRQMRRARKAPWPKLSPLPTSPPTPPQSCPTGSGSRLEPRRVTCRPLIMKEAPRFPNDLGASREKLGMTGRGLRTSAHFRMSAAQQPALQLGAGGEWPGKAQAGTFLSLVAYEARETFRAEAVEGVLGILVQQTGPTIQALAGITEVTCNDSSDSETTNHSLSKYLGDRR